MNVLRVGLRPARAQAWRQIAVASTRTYASRPYVPPYTVEARGPPETRETRRIVMDQHANKLAAENAMSDDERALRAAAERNGIDLSEPENMALLEQALLAERNADEDVSPMDNLDEQRDDHPDDGHPYNLFSEDPEHELDEEDAYKILDKWDRSQRDIPMRPETPGFYTGRDRYYDTLWKLRAACGSAKNTLKIMQLWPLPTFARASLVPLPAVWADLATMNQVGGMRINRTRYSTLLNVLAEMHELLRISISAGVQDIADTLESLMTMFEGSEQRKLAIANAGKVHQKTLDRFGRSYNVGRRKTSSARVWIIPTRLGTVTAPTGAESIGGEDAPASEPSLPTTTVLVNNLPLHHYFPNSLERERVTYPLRVAGVLGKYNIFALARGGGHTGQSGAIAHGIANGLTTHDIQLYRVLKKAGLLRRDPRQVERKKTNRPSARSGYRWTKR